MKPVLRVKTGADIGAVWYTTDCKETGVSERMGTKFDWAAQFSFTSMIEDGEVVRARVSDSREGPQIRVAPAIR